MRRPEGKVKKLKIKGPFKWEARITYTDPETQMRRDVRRRFETEGDAQADKKDHAENPEATEKKNRSNEANARNAKADG